MLHEVMSYVGASSISRKQFILLYQMAYNDVGSISRKAVHDAA